MAQRTQIRSLTVNDFSTKSREEILAENFKNQRVRQLTALRIYHENKIKEIVSELETMLKDDIGNIEY